MMADAEAREKTSRLEGEKSRLEEDVREHVRAEKTLETERDFLAAVLESADVFILALDNAGCIVGSNRAVKLATGYREEDLIGREFISALPIRAAAATLSDGLRRLGEGAGAYAFESHWMTSTGERLLVAGSLTPVHDAGGALAHVIVTASDISKRRDLEDELRSMSLHDDLTGIYNRRGFALLAEQRLKDSRRSGSTLTIIYADIDQMKTINDSFGHDAGDTALSICAGALESTFRESDIVARIGGDEFAILEETDAPSISTVTLRLEQELDRRTSASDLQCPLSLTIGYAHSGPPHALSLDALLEQADAVMYEHKLGTPPQPE